MKVVVFEVEPREALALEGLKAQNEIVLVEGPLREANAAEFSDAEVISPFIYSTLDRRVLEKLPALKLIATRSTGFDHIDIAYCATRGITVSNVPTYGENTVAEHVFALLLTISHRMREAIERARTGQFSPLGLQGFDLAGKTLGVVGTGSIGCNVIRTRR
jgi:D-lactate dehydrogenase